MNGTFEKQKISGTRIRNDYKTLVVKKRKTSIKTSERMSETESLENEWNDEEGFEVLTQVDSKIDKSNSETHESLPKKQRNTTTPLKYNQASNVARNNGHKRPLLNEMSSELNNFELIKTTDNSEEKKRQRRSSLLSQMVAGLKENASKQIVKPETNQKESLAFEVGMSEAAFIQDLETQSVVVEDDFYGLPIAVCKLIETHKGITQLYDWQNECLRLTAIQQRRNLIYSLPTSGGKTLVAEILMWREVLYRKKDVVLVLPYVSIVQEKVQAMTSFAMELDFAVEEYAGSKGQIPPRTHRKKHCIYIATIEKAHTLVNVLIELKRIEEIGLVVVDEFHMIGDGGSRGASLECLLTKLLYVAESTMIVGMSATLGNINDLSRFLDAEVYTRDFRPVELKEYIKVNKQIFEVNPKALCDEDRFKYHHDCLFPYTNEMVGQDPDYIGGLVMEVVPKNSCLIFCSSRKNCENVALLICRTMPKELKLYKTKEKMELYETLKVEGKGKVCPVLRRTIAYGVAYHHSGLTMDERRFLEEAYSNGTLSCIVCTSTLAAGVNLPAKRVIIRSPYVGSEFITYSRLKQMIGRAGRAGIDTSGESIVIVNPSDSKKIGNVLAIQVDHCKSSICYENNKGIKILLLSAFGLGIIKTEEEAVKLVSKTLFYIQCDKIIQANLPAFVKEALVDLQKHKLLEFSSEIMKQEIVSSPSWSVSKLGRATFKGSIEMDRSSILYSDLVHGLKALALNSHLHLLYLITPYDMVDSTVPIPRIYYEVYSKLSSVDNEAADIIGITEACMTRVVIGQRTTGVTDSKLRRFYLTLVLYELWHQNSIWDVSDKFEIPRGHVQNLLSNSASFANCILHFCQELDEFWAYQDLLATFVKRLSNCVHMELVPLMELPCIKQGRARLLYEAGYKTLNILAQSDPDEIVQKVKHVPKKVAREIVTAAKVIIRQKVEALQEEAEDLVSVLRITNV